VYPLSLDKIKNKKEGLIVSGISYIWSVKAISRNVYFIYTEEMVLRRES
jgi:hypothetical protein